MLSNRLTLQGDCFSRVTKKSASNAGAREALSQRLVVEDLEPAALDHRGHIAAAKTKGRVGRKNRVSQNAWLVSIRIDRDLQQDHAAPWVCFVAHREVRVKA